ARAHGPRPLAEALERAAVDPFEEPALTILGLGTRELSAQDLSRAFEPPEGAADLILGKTRRAHDLREEERGAAGEEAPDDLVERGLVARERALEHGSERAREPALLPSHVAPD